MIDLSVIVPTFDRAPVLDRCLAALAGQAAAPSFEIVVVDDGSKDDTARVVERHRAQLPLRYERRPHRGQAAALNHGLDVAVGRYCLFLDDDVVAEPRLLAEHLRGQRQAAGAVAMGNLSLRLPDRAGGLARYVERWWHGQYGAFERGDRRPTFRNCYSGNISMPRDALRAAGGFAEWIPRSFDVELAYRLTNAGLLVVFLPDARAVQVYDKGFAAITRDFDRAGRAAVEMYRREPPILSHLPLGNFWQAGPHAGRLRRALLAVRAPVWPLGIADRLLQGPRSDRLYGFLQDYCYWRGVQWAERDRAVRRRLFGGVVILLYHAVGAPGERASRYVIPAVRLRRQLRWLRLRRYTLLGLDEYVRHRRRHTLPPARSVVITFDDGFRDNAELGHPLLRRESAPATVFLVSGGLGGRNTWSPGSVLADRPLMTWEQAKDLREAGVELGAHTKTHRPLPGLTPEQLEDEIAGSRAELEARLGPMRHFAYPYGKVDEAATAAVDRAGFDSACGIEEGRNCAGTPLLALRRCEIHGTDSLLRFVRTLVLGRRPGA